MEFPEVVGTWVESRHVAGAAYVPSPEDPPPPCFGDFCFETFYCGYLGDAEGSGTSIGQVLRGQGENLHVQQGVGDTWEEFQTSRMPAAGGDVENLAFADGFVLLNRFFYEPFNRRYESPFSYVAFESVGTGYWSFDPERSAFAVSAGSEVVVRYTIPEVLPPALIDDENTMRRFESPTRVWYVTPEGEFFFVDSVTGTTSTPIPSLAAFPHSKSGSEVNWFRELLDGRLTLLQVDEYVPCDMQPEESCESRWSIVVMDSETGAIDLVPVDDGPENDNIRPQLVADVDGYLVLLEEPANDVPGGLVAGMYLISIETGTRVALPGAEGLPLTVMDEDRELMVYGAADGRVFVYDADAGGAQEWFDLTPGAEGPVGLNGHAMERPFASFALAGGRLFVTYPWKNPGPCVYVADLP